MLKRIMNGTTTYKDAFLVKFVGIVNFLAGCIIGLYLGFKERRK